MRRLSIVAVATAALAMAACGSSASKAATTTTTVVETASTTTPPTTVARAPSTTSAAPAVTPSAAVWPDAGATTRFTDPVAAARSFATSFAGFVNPLVGPFHQGDSRSGEVEVRPTASGPVTTVLLRQLAVAGDSSWSVLGAATANIVIDAPAARAEVSSPVTLRGRSTAFEATVSAEVRQDGSPTPLGTGVVMGGANGHLGPFTGTLTYSHPTAPAGALVLSTRSAKDGRVREVAVLRIHFAGR